MTLVNLTQGLYNLSFKNGGLLLTPLSEDNHESFAPPSQMSNNRQFPIVRQPSPHFYTSALGLAGGIGLVVSCVWSILLPAIGSIGVMAFAYLVDRKITLLHPKELPPEAIKSQNIFEKIGSKVGSGSLLDGYVDIGNLPPPMSPMYNDTNQSNISLFMPGSESLLDEPAVVIGNLPPPMSPTYNATNKSNIPPPPPFSSGTPTLLTMPSISKPQKKCPKIDSSCIDLKNTRISTDPNQKLLDSIRNSFNFIQIKELLRESEKYPSNLLIKELKTTYKRALAIGELPFLGKTYFKDKIDRFEKNFDVAEKKENQTPKEMEDICKKANHLDSHLKNMKWIQSLLQILSERKDLSEEVRKHCSEKLKTIEKHIKTLQDRNIKKISKASGYNTQDSSSHNKEPASISIQGMSPAMMLARREAIAYSDSSSSSEGESDHEDNWNN